MAVAAAFVPNKKRILYDENLHNLSERGINRIYECENAEQGTMLIAHMKQLKPEDPESMGESGMVRFEWKCPKDVRVAVTTYQNNLDSLSNYDEPGVMDVLTVFALLECFRSHFKSEFIHIVQTNNVYVLPNSLPPAGSSG
jgi:hypothetical protein